MVINIKEGPRCFSLVWRWAATWWRWRWLCSRWCNYNFNSDSVSDDSISQPATCRTWNSMISDQLSLEPSPDLTYQGPRSDQRLPDRRSATLDFDEFHCIWKPTANTMLTRLLGNRKCQLDKHPVWEKTSGMTGAAADEWSHITGGQKSTALYWNHS